MSTIVPAAALFMEEEKISLRCICVGICVSCLVVHYVIGGIRVQRYTYIHTDRGGSSTYIKTTTKSGQISRRSDLKPHPSTTDYDESRRVLCTTTTILANISCAIAAMHMAQDLYFQSCFSCISVYTCSVSYI